MLKSSPDATDPAANATKEGTVTLADGRIIAYAEYGDPEGTVIFGFHGTPGSRKMFAIADEPARRSGIRLVAPERPGFGRSSYHRRRTLGSYAADIAAFANALGIGRFAVAGISGGAPYAAACAACLPERVSALALVSPIGPMAGPECPQRIGLGHRLAFRYAPRAIPLLAMIFAIGRLGFLYAPNLLLGFIMSRAAPSDWRILSREEVRHNLLRGVAEGCRPGIGASLQEMAIFSRPWGIPLGDIRAPTFLWQGLSDRNVPVSAALQLGKLIPGCQVTQLEKAGHYWIFDNIPLVLETLAGAAGQDEPQMPQQAPNAAVTP